MALRAAPREELRRLEQALEDTDPAADRDGFYSLHFRAAQLCLGLAADEARDEALEHLRAAWQARPGDQDALAVLAGCLEPLALAELCAAAADQVTAPEERAELLTQAARGFVAADQRERAATLYLALLGLPGERLASRRRAAARALLELADAANTGDGGSLTEPRELELRSAALPELSGDDALACALRLGQLQRQAGAPELALASYRLALSLRPSAPAALDPVREELASQRRLDELADLLTSAAATAETGAARAELWREVADLCEGPLGDAERAAAAWWHAWDSCPTGDEPSHLKRIYTEREAWDAYVKVLVRQALCARGGADKTEVYHELATLQWEVLDDPRAATATYRYLLQIAPEDLEALRALVELYDELDDEPGLAAALRRCAEAEDQPGAREALLRRLARLELRRGRVEPALRCLRRLDVALPQNSKLLRDLHAGLTQRRPAAGPGRPEADQQRALRRKLEGLLLTTADDAQVLDLARRYAAEGDPGPAADLCAHLLERTPEHADGRQLLEQLERRLRREEEAPAATLARRAEAIAARQPQQALRLLIRAAVIAGQDREQPAGEQAGSGPVSEAQAPPEAETDDVELRAEAEAEQQPEARARALEAGAPDRAPGEEQREPQEQEAELEGDGALQTIAQQLEADAEQGPPLASEEQAEREAREAHGRRYLRRALALCQQPSGWSNELRLLETALRDAEMYWELADLLAAAAERARGAQRQELLRTLAELLAAELGQPARAAAVLTQALALDPSDQQLARQLLAVQRALGDKPAMAITLEQIAGQGAPTAEVLEELAALAEELGDPQAALRHYQRLLERDPAHPAALACCRRHDERRGDHRAVAVRLARAAELCAEPMARAELHREIAQIAEHQLNDLDFAIAHWRKVVEAFPGDAAPRGELKRLLLLAGHHEDVEMVLLSEVSRSAPEQKIPLYLELATLASKQLRNSRAAAAYLRNALQLAPQRREVMERLEEIYEETSQWRELAGVLRRHADAEPALDAKVRLLLRAAHVLLAHLGREEEALAICRRVRELHPGERASAKLMHEVYGQRQQWRQLAALLREQLNHETDPGELGRLQIELGRLLLERLQEPEAAATHFELALDLDSGRGDVLPVLRQIYASMERWDLLTALIGRRANAEELAPADRAAALCEIGRIHQEQRGDLEQAAEAYEGALQLVPDHRAALSALGALSVTRGRHRDAVTLARRELEQIEDQPERARKLLEIAGLLAEELERPAAAAEALEEALDNDPGLTSAAEQLARIYFEDQDWERAGRFLEQVVNSGVELSQIHEYFYRLAYACEQLGRAEDAFAYYVKSFGREPLYLPTLNRLVELCYRRRQWDNTLRITEAIIETYAAQKTDEELAELYVRYGLCKIHLSQQQAALQLMQRLLLGPDDQPQVDPSAWQDVAERWAATPLEPKLLPLVDPDVLTHVIKAMEEALARVKDHAGALQILAALTVCRKDWDRSLRYLERLAEREQLSRRQRALLLVSAGDIAARQLHALQRAEAYYRHALELLPGSHLARQRLERLRAPTSHHRPRLPTGRELPPPPRLPRIRSRTTEPVLTEPPPPLPDVPLDSRTASGPPLPPGVRPLQHRPSARPVPAGEPPSPPPTPKRPAPTSRPPSHEIHEAGPGRTDPSSTTDGSRAAPPAPPDSPPQRTPPRPTGGLEGTPRLPLPSRKKKG